MQGQPLACILAIRLLGLFSRSSDGKLTIAVEQPGALHAGSRFDVYVRS